MHIGDTIEYEMRKRDGDWVSVALRKLHKKPDPITEINKELAKIDWEAIQKGLNDQPMTEEEVTCHMTM